MSSASGIHPGNAGLPDAFAGLESVIIGESVVYLAVQPRTAASAAATLNNVNARGHRRDRG